MQKSDDRIYLESKWGYQATGNLYYSADFNFRSQFSNTYEYPTPSAKADGSALGEGEEYEAADWRHARVLKSGLLSPATTNLGLGLDYKPFKWLSVNLAPLTGGFVIVDNPKLRASNGQPLKNRTNIVLTSNPDYKVKDAVIVHSKEELLKTLEQYDSENIYIIGGESIYRMMLPYCDTVFVTKIDRAFQADTFFPNLDEMEEWQMTEEGEEQTCFDLEFRFTKYERRQEKA